MAAILYKWLLAGWLQIMLAGHPLFISVTQVEHNATNKTLEVSCKIFTDDLETTLRKQYKNKIDLLNTGVRDAMNPIVNDYVKKHLSFKVEGKPVVMDFIGFEQAEEGVMVYYEIKNIPVLHHIEVTNNVLYEAKPQQMDIIHVIVNGERKSTKLNNPDATASFDF